MRFAFISFSRPAATLSELLSLARELEYDAIEPRAESKHGHGVELTASAEQRRDIARRIEDSGIAVCCVATSCQLALPEVAQVEKAKRYIDLAADVGCSRIRVFAGEGGSDTLIASLRALAPHAAERNVAVCLESHDSHCDPRVLAKVMRAVDHPNAGIVWDVMHTQRQGGSSMAEAHAILVPWIRHVHVHDGEDTLERLVVLPIGTGDFDHAEVIRLLKQSNYDGYVSGEWIESIMSPEFFARHLEMEIRTLRGMDMAH